MKEFYLKMEIEFNKPEQLSKDSTVSLVNPSSQQEERFHRNTEIIEYLDSLGFEAQDHTALQGNDAERIAKFNQAVNSGSKAIFPVAGNSHSEHLIEELDFEALKTLKPIFTTFSAASTLQLAISTRANLETFYGPHISFIQSKSSHRENQYTIASYLNMLCGTSARWGLRGKLGAIAFRNTVEGNRIIMRNIISQIPDLDKLYDGEPIPFIGTTDKSETIVTGKLMPTFLQSLNMAAKIGLELNMNDNILLIETNDTSYEEALIYMQEIHNVYNLSNLSAIVLASFIHRKRKPSDMGYSLYDEDRAQNFVKQVQRLTNYNIPVIYGFPIGHGRYKLTVPFGINSDLDLTNGDIYLRENPLNENKKT
jgi:muramoyltetrapeptide carboxypeptidase LdcA involved in peptidoglycan recycling